MFCIGTAVEQPGEYKRKLRLESLAKGTVTNTKHRFPFLQATQNRIIDFYAAMLKQKGGGGCGQSVADDTI